MTIKRDLQPKLLVVVPLSINKRKKEAEKKERKRGQQKSVTDFIRIQNSCDNLESQGWKIMSDITNKDPHLSVLLLVVIVYLLS